MTPAVYRPSSWTSKLAVWSASGGVVTGLDTGNRTLSLPLRCGTQGEVQAYSQHQAVELPVEIVTHVQTINPDFAYRALHGRDVHSTADQTFVLTRRMNQYAKRATICRLDDDVVYTDELEDKTLLGLAQSHQVDAVVLPAVKGDGKEAARRLGRARNLMERLPPEMRKQVFIALHGSSKKTPAALNYLATLGEAFILIEWHGEFATSTRLLKDVHDLMRGAPGDVKPTVMAFNAPRQFRGLPGSVPLMLARWGIQGTAYRVGNPAQFLAMQKQNQEKGELPVPQQYSRLLGGWTSRPEELGPCACPAHDDAIAPTLGSFHAETPLFQRMRVHEVWAHAADREAVRHAIYKDALPAFVESRPLLAASLNG